MTLGGKGLLQMSESKPAGKSKGGWVKGKHIFRVEEGKK